MTEVKQIVKQNSKNGGQLAKLKWQRVDLNHWPRAYESPALPLSYAAQERKEKNNISQP